MAYGVIMVLKFLLRWSRLLIIRVTKKLKDGDKMEHYVYWGIVIQMVLITSHLLWDWPNLYFMLLPGMIIIGSYFVILAALLIGSLRINADQISKKRYQLGIAGLATLFLLLFLIHITDKFFRGKSVPDVLLCIEFLIPEVLYFFQRKLGLFSGLSAAPHLSDDNSCAPQSLPPSGIPEFRPPNEACVHSQSGGNAVRLSLAAATAVLPREPRVPLADLRAAVPVVSAVPRDQPVPVLRA